MLLSKNIDDLFVAFVQSIVPLFASISCGQIGRITPPI